MWRPGGVSYSVDSDTLASQGEMRAKSFWRVLFCIQGTCPLRRCLFPEHTSSCSGDISSFSLLLVLRCRHEGHSVFSVSPGIRQQLVTYKSPSSLQLSFCADSHVNLMGSRGSEEAGGSSAHRTVAYSYLSESCGPPDMHCDFLTELTLLALLRE